MVPYLIWTNYDLPEAGEGPEISLNYLSTLLAQQAGLPLTDYQRFLQEGMEVLPVVNSVGYVDGTGTSTADPNLLTEQAQDYLKQYRIVQYNNLFDAANRRDAFFSSGED